jgi:hypothetical protein
MKLSLRFYLLVFSFLFLATRHSKAQFVAIPDVNFRTYLETFYPACMSGGMMDTTCTEVITQANLVVSDSGITNLTGVQYFDGLTYLDCSNCQLSSLPPLPSSLIYLTCRNNKLTSLPSLPGSIRQLDCLTNQLTTLPVLPSSLNYFRCSENKLSSLPSLPDSLTIFDCSYNLLVSLPSLPDTLDYLRCTNNLLVSLPSLPDSLTELYCNDNYINCLPFLPKKMIAVYAGGNSITCLPNIPNLVFTSDITTQVCKAFDNNGTCVAFPLITGKVFIDNNSNGSQEAGESNLSFAKIEIQPGNYIAQADSAGFYTINVDTGEYTISLYSTAYPYYTASTPTHIASFTHNGEIDSLNNFALTANGVVNDLKVTLTPLGSVRAGRETGYQVRYQNVGTTVLNGDVKLAYDGRLTFNTSFPVFDSHINDTLRWNYSTLKPGEEGKITAYFTPPANINTGADIFFNATINPQNGDSTPESNKDSLVHIVIGSYDPNFKEVLPAGDITPDQVLQQDPFIYIVHFQNTGNDTAFVVSIRDTISTNFEVLKIETLAASHNYSFKMKDDIAIWTFNNILLPDSTTNERLSHGFVKYRVIPKNTLVINDEIKNTADIYFDYNIPVKTNTTLNRVAMPTEINKEEISTNFKIYPNPSKGMLTMNTPIKGTGTVKVWSLDGRIVYNKEGVNFSELIFIDLEKEQKGIYFVQAISGGQIVTKKLVLN